MKILKLILIIFAISFFSIAYADTGEETLDDAIIQNICRNPIRHINALTTIGVGTPCAGIGSGTFIDVSNVKKITNSSDPSGLPYKAKCSGNKLSISVRVTKAGGFTETLNIQQIIDPKNDLDENGNYNKNILDLIKQRLNIELPSGTPTSPTTEGCNLVPAENGVQDGQSLCQTNIGDENATVQSSKVSCQKITPSNPSIAQVDNTQNDKNKNSNEIIQARKKYLETLKIKAQFTSDGCARSTMAELAMQLGYKVPDEITRERFESLTGKKWKYDAPNSSFGQAGYTDNSGTYHPSYWEKLANYVNNEGSLVMGHTTGDNNNQHWYQIFYVDTANQVMWITDPNRGRIRPVGFNSQFVKPTYNDKTSNITYTVVSGTENFWQKHTSNSFQAK